MMVSREVACSAASSSICALVLGERERARARARERDTQVLVHISRSLSSQSYIVKAS